jgi:hypothetical protein
LSRDQASCDLAGETVVVNLSSGRYYGLGTVGQRVWTLLTQPRPVHELRDAIVADFDVDPDTCADDLVTLLEQLAREGLVEVTA